MDIKKNRYKKIQNNFGFLLLCWHCHRDVLHRNIAIAVDDYGCLVKLISLGCWVAFPRKKKEKERRKDSAYPLNCLSFILFLSSCLSSSFSSFSSCCSFSSTFISFCSCCSSSSTSISFCSCCSLLCAGLGECCGCWLGG